MNIVEAVRLAGQAGLIRRKRTLMPVDSPWMEVKWLGGMGLNFEDLTADNWEIRDKGIMVNRSILESAVQIALLGENGSCPAQFTRDLAEALGI